MTRIGMLCIALGLFMIGFGLGQNVGYSNGLQQGLDTPREVLVQTGTASWYGPGFHGRTAADGSTYDQHAMTAAHRFLPFGTKVRVTNLKNGVSVVVTITDRGPYIGQRVIDMSRGSAERLGMVQDGLAKVRIHILEA